MIVLDTSALACMLMPESDASLYLERIAAADRISLSSVTMLEFAIVMQNKRGRGGAQDAVDFIENMKIQSVPFDGEMEALAIKAYQR